MRQQLGPSVPKKVFVQGQSGQRRQLRQAVAETAETVWRDPVVAELQRREAGAPRERDGQLHDLAVIPAQRGIVKSRGLDQDSLEGLLVLLFHQGPVRSVRESLREQSLVEGLRIRGSGPLGCAGAHRAQEVLTSVVQLAEVEDHAGRRDQPGQSLLEGRPTAISIARGVRPVRSTCDHPQADVLVRVPHVDVAQTALEGGLLRHGAWLLVQTAPVDEDCNVGSLPILGEVPEHTTDGLQLNSVWIRVLLREPAAGYGHDLVLRRQPRGRHGRALRQFLPPRQLAAADGQAEDPIAADEHRVAVLQRRFDAGVPEEVVRVGGRRPARRDSRAAAQGRRPRPRSSVRVSGRRLARWAATQRWRLRPDVLCIGRCWHTRHDPCAAAQG
mmetsp:Transcript_14565/g.41741  ORF Transcript_14565/g.41741 Transcript_14565/m.41741 type:complete len:386 (+) Transcript_14565:323-1480(+)